MSAKQINWNRPVETFDGFPVEVVRPGLIRGLPVDLERGRKQGKDATWRYTNYGLSQVSFLPAIRNVSA